jgi:hypothetical protein
MGGTMSREQLALRGQNHLKDDYIDLPDPARRTRFCSNLL